MCQSGALLADWTMSILSAVYTRTPFAGLRNFVNTENSLPDLPIMVRPVGLQKIAIRRSDSSILLS